MAEEKEKAKEIETQQSKDTEEVKKLLAKIQTKLQTAAFTELAIVEKLNERIENKFIEQPSNEDFNNFIKKIEMDSTDATQVIAKKLRVAYLYINLDELPLYNPATPPLTGATPPLTGTNGTSENPRRLALKSTAIQSKNSQGATFGEGSATELATTLATGSATELGEGSGPATGARAGSELGEGAGASKTLARPEGGEPATTTGSAGASATTTGSAGGEPATGSELGEGAGAGPTK